MPLLNDVWVIYPGKMAARFLPSRNIVRAVCKKRGWDFQERPTVTVNLHAGGRAREILSTPVATAMYRRAHRARVAVIVLAPTHVFLHPSQEAAIRKRAIARLQELFWYKCFVELLDEKTECNEQWVNGFADRFENACLRSACSDEHDPRCLPLHVFTNSGNRDLFTADGRADFDKTYGAGAHRVDLDERQWRLNPRAFHGHESLHIAGTPLPKGFHWDVQPGGDSTLVVTTSDVWLVSRYVNIYPDSHIRGDRPHARKLI